MSGPADRKRQLHREEPETFLITLSRPGQALGDQRSAPCARSTLMGFSRFAEMARVFHLFAELEPSQTSAQCVFRKEGIYLHNVH